MNVDIFYDPTNQQLDDKLFSPVHAHFPTDFYYQANNQSELQYGTSENISEFFDSVVNWDSFSYATSSLDLGSSFLNPKDNGSGSDSDVEMTNMLVSNRSDPFYPLVILDFFHQNDFY